MKTCLMTSHVHHSKWGSVWLCLSYPIALLRYMYGFSVKYIGLMTAVLVLLLVGRDLWQMLADSSLSDVSRHTKPCVLGVIQNFQHYQERTPSTLFCDPLPRYQKGTLKMLIWRPILKIVMPHKRHFKRTVAIDPLHSSMCSSRSWKSWQF